MILWRRYGKVPALLAGGLLLLFGCAAAPRAPLALDPAFAAEKIRKVAVLPVTFVRRYEPPYDIDLDSELRSRIRTVLEKKGYVVTLAQKAAGKGSAATELTPNQLKALAPPGTEAALAIHVDFLFISETYSDLVPPPVIEVEAEARLTALPEGKELWRDRGHGRAGGVGGTRIFYPTAERFLALTLLAENLLATLPPAGK